MKNLFNILLFLGCVWSMNACTKTPDDLIADDKGADDIIESSNYTFNTATKAFEPTADIEARVSSQKDINWIYAYLIREGSADSLLHVFYTRDLEDKRDIDLTIDGALFANIPMENVSGLKLMIKRSDNSADEAFITIQSFTPPLPQWENVPPSLRPDDDGIVQVTATALSENGITKIELYDDYQGTFVKIHEITLNKEQQYALDYDYTYRANTANLKLVMYDDYGLQSEAIIAIPVLPYEIYKDVTMSAQGTSAVTFYNSAVILPAYTFIGPCDFANNETNISFLFYNTSNGPTFYAPTNATSVIANYRCNGVQYVPTIPVTNWTATRFRVLNPENSIQGAIYDAYNTNNIPSLEDDFFTGVAVPSSSAPRYGTASDQFNEDSNYLVWARIPNPDKTINVLLRIKSVNQNGNESTITFDLLVPKE